MGLVPAGAKRYKPARVLSFVEKPDAVRARSLIKRGALWNMFVIAGSVRALLDLYDASHGMSVALMRSLIGGRKLGAIDSAALGAVYQQLPSVDFSRDVLAPQAAKLRVLGVPPCGWNDLGTPKRVVETLREEVPAQYELLEGVRWASAALKSRRPIWQNETTSAIRVCRCSGSSSRLASQPYPVATYCANS